MPNKYSKENLEEAVKKSNSISDVLRYLEENIVGGTHNHIKQKIIQFNIDTNHFNYRNSEYYKISKAKSENQLKNKLKNRLHFSKILVKNRLSNRREHHWLLKRALIESGVEYKCEVCKIKIYKGKPLSLHIHHIDKNIFNNEQKNLCFLCPNCHSQTENYGPRKKEKTPINKLEKSIKLKIKNIKEPKIRKKRIPLKNWPSDEELKKLVWEYPLSYLSNILKISDVAIRKKCIKNHISIPKKGYWQKIKAGKTKEEALLPKKERKKRRVFSEKEVEEIKNLFAQKLSLREIAKKLNCHHSTISKYLKGELAESGLKQKS